MCVYLFVCLFVYVLIYLFVYLLFSYCGHLSELQYVPTHIFFPCSMFFLPPYKVEGNLCSCLFSYPQKCINTDHCIIG